MIKELSGGTSNKIYLLNDNIILRLYGKNSDTLVDHKNEKYITNELSKLNISPKIVCDFDGGRLEEFIKNSRLPTTNDLLTNKEILINVIKKMRELHNVKLNLNENPILIKNICDWTYEAKNINSLYTEIYELKDYILDKLKNIKTLGIVLCHNDLQKNNILVNNNDLSVNLIDFEYCGYNFIEFEIANFLCELFMEYNEHTSKVDVFDLTNISELVCELYTNNYDEMRILLNNLKIFFVATNYLWIMWSIIKNNNDKSFNHDLFIKQRTDLLKMFIGN